jgi:hypothetical protein
VLFAESQTCDRTIARGVGFAARNEPGDVLAGPEQLPVDATGRRLAVLVHLVENGCAPDHGPGTHVAATAGELVVQGGVRRAPRDSSGKRQALLPRLLDHLGGLLERARWSVGPLDGSGQVRGAD